MKGFGETTKNTELGDISRAKETVIRDNGLTVFLTEKESVLMETDRVIREIGKTINLTETGMKSMKTVHRSEECFKAA